MIIGRQGDETWQQIDVREMAAAIGTIPYESFAGLAPNRATIHVDPDARMSGA